MKLSPKILAVLARRLAARQEMAMASFEQWKADRGNEQALSDYTCVLRKCQSLAAILNG